MNERIDREALAKRLEKTGIDKKLIGDISADLGDLHEALFAIAGRYQLIADGAPPGPLLDEIESEARDHMVGHVRSLQRTVVRIRKQWGPSRIYVERDNRGRFRQKQGPRPAAQPPSLRSMSRGRTTE